ncbi:hypothetical protein Tco_1547045 [Tanacetum coccineum]
MQGASCTQRKVSMVHFVFSIPFVLSWGGSISSDSFLPSILLFVVIIVMVIVTVVVVVVAIGGVPSILKLSFMFIGVSLGPVVLLVFAMLAACASRAAEILSTTSSSRTGLLPSGRVDLTGDEDPTDEDGDIGMGDSIDVSASLGGEIFSGGKKSQESNIGDSDNTRDGGTTVGGGIVTCGGLMASYACITFI